MKEPLLCIFRGHTAIRGLAVETPDGMYRAVVIITKGRGMARTEVSPEISANPFRTYIAAARYGLDFGYQLDCGTDDPLAARAWDGASNEVSA